MPALFSKQLLDQKLALFLCRLFVACQGTVIEGLRKPARGSHSSSRAGKSSARSTTVYWAHRSCWGGFSRAIILPPAALIKVNPNPKYRGSALYIYIGQKIAQIAPPVSLAGEYYFSPKDIGYTHQSGRQKRIRNYRMRSYFTNTIFRKARYCPALNS